MSNDKKQTAVDWLMEQLSYDNGYGVRVPSHREDANLNEYFEKAKAMEKEQIKDSYQSDRFPCSEEDSEQYYNETYGGDK